MKAMRICNKWFLSTVSMLSLFKETLGYVKQAGCSHPSWGHLTPVDLGPVLHCVHGILRYTGSSSSYTTEAGSVS